MFKSIKKVLLGILFCFLILWNINIKADDVYYNDDKSAYYKPVEVLLEGSYDYTNYQKIKAVTGYNGEESNQLIYTYVQKQTKDSKVVTWGVKKDSGKLENANLPYIAIDYEANHKDWIVVGGVNADQYTTGFGTNVASSGKDFYSPQTYYPLICDYEGWFAVTAIPYYGHNIAGFLQNGESDPIISGSASLNNGEIKLEGLYLYVLDEDGNRINKFEVNKFNESPKAYETALWTSFFNKDNEFDSITIKNKCFAVIKAERAYPSNSIDYSEFKGENGYNAFFGKGKITKYEENVTIGYGDFAIETSNEDVLNALSEGVRILVQYEYEGVLGDVESATGYHTIQRLDGVDMPGVGDYNTSAYPRSVFGRTIDGDIVLLAVDGKAKAQGRTGTKHWETNAILNSLGVVEAYQMDGGGSVTAIIRNESGGFDVINNPADGAARRVLTGLLLVERKKPEVTNIKINSERNKIIFEEIQIDDHGNDVSKSVLVFDGKEYDINNNSIIIDGLDGNKEYSYYIKSYYNGEEVIIKEDICFTSTFIPEVKNIKETKEEGFEIEFEDIDNNVIEYYIIIEKEKYYPDKNRKIKINKIVIGKSYIVYKYKVHNKEYEERVDFQPYKFVNELEKILESVYNTIDDIYN